MGYSSQNLGVPISIQPFKAPPFFFLHPLLYLDPLRNNHPPFCSELEVNPIHPEGFQRLPFYKTILLRALAVEVERLFQPNRWIDDDSRDTQIVLGRGVHHQWMQKDHITHFSSQLHKAVALLDLLKMIPKPWVLLRFFVGSVRWDQCEVRGNNTFRMFGEIMRNLV